MDESILQLMEELVASIELREAGDPNAPASGAQRRIERLEEELAQRFRAGPQRSVTRVAAPDEVLAGSV